MDREHLPHLPVLEKITEGSYRLIERAIVKFPDMGRFEVGIYGIWHKKADPRGMPQCEIYIPDSDFYSLIYRARPKRWGNTIPHKEAIFCPMVYLLAYKSVSIDLDFIATAKYPDPKVTCHI